MREIRRKYSLLSMCNSAKNSFYSINELRRVSSECFHYFVMFKIGKYLSAKSRRKIKKILSWKNEETVFMQTIIDYILTSCIVSVTAAVGMAAT